MKKARLSIRSIVSHDIDHRHWDILGKHVHTKVRTIVWDTLGYAFDDQYVDTITDIIRSKS
jgi:hypothetical protein